MNGETNTCMGIQRKFSFKRYSFGNYEKMFWQKPHIDAIHAGLECGLFCGKMPDCDMVSIGPEMANVHTPDEVISVSSVERTYNYLLAVLKNLK